MARISTGTVRPPPLLLLVGLVAFGPLSTDLYLPSLPDMTRVFATDVSHVQLTLSVFLVGLALAQLIYGPLSDRFGRRPILLGGTMIYVVSVFLCLIAPTVQWLIFGRFFQAVGACSGGVVSRAIVRDVYPPSQAARVLSLMATAMALAPAVAPLIGGLLHATFGWRANFVVMMLFGVGLLIAGWRLLDETIAEPNLVALRPMTMVETYALLLGNRHFMGHTATLSLCFAAMFAFISGASFVVIDVLGGSPLQFGLCFAFVVIGYMCGSFSSARLSQKVDLERLIRFGVLAGALGAILMIGLALAKVQTIPAVVGPIAVCFFGAGLTLPNSTAAAIMPHGRIAGSASALLGFLQMSCGAVTGWVVGRLHDGTTLPTAAVVCAMWIAAAVVRALVLR